MDDTDAYVMAMCLNPIIKMAFIEASWDPQYVAMAHAMVESNVSTFF
jgi:hypothetical protein